MKRNRTQTSFTTILFVGGRVDRPLFLKILRKEVFNINFFERIHQRVEKIQHSNSLKNWIAESPSRQSARPNQVWRPHIRSARQAIAVLFLALFIPEWESWEIIKQIRDQAYFQKYAGEWNKVQIILEQVQTLADFEKELPRIMSEDDFFGNLIPLCEKLLYENPNAYYQAKPTVRKPKRRIRHRGYRDKGSLRPYHQRGRNIGDSNPGEDRREKVIYGHLPDL